MKYTKKELGKVRKGDKYRHSGSCGCRFFFFNLTPEINQKHLDEEGGTKSYSINPPLGTSDVPLIGMW